jgi:putative DNA primase/helicase
MQDATAPTGAIITTNGPARILPHHLAGLRARGLTDATIAAAGLTSETSRDKLAALLRWKRPGKTIAPAIVIPFYGADGSNGYARVRPDVPRLDRNGKPVKYESPKGEPNRIYLPPGDAQHLANTAQELALTEGEFKALALSQELLPTIGLVGIGGWKEKDHQRLLPELERVAWSGRKVYLIPDSDFGTNENVATAVAWLAKHLSDRGAVVKLVRLPDGAPDASGKPAKMGADDYLAAHGKGAMRKLIDAAEDPPPVNPESAKENGEHADPADEAKSFLEETKQDDVYRLRFRRDAFYYWTAGRYVETPLSEVEAEVTTALNRHFYNVRRGTVANVVAQIKAQSILYSQVKLPAWLGGNKGEWHPDEMIVAKNGLVHLPTLITGGDYLCPATPQFFTYVALDHDYDHCAPAPEAWLSFLNDQLWRDDAQSVEALQEWCGYCLTADTRQQKMLLLVGPRRSGKVRSCPSRRCR